MGFVEVKGQPIKISWAKPQKQGPSSAREDSTYGEQQQQQQQPPLPPGVADQGLYFVPPPPPPGVGGAHFYYPSQDPRQLGSYKPLPKT